MEREAAKIRTAASAEPAAPSRGARSNPAATYALLGGVLGFGAPLGYLVLRRLVGAAGGAEPCALARDRKLAYGYLSVATPIVFGAFGWLLGREQSKLALSHAQVERLREEFAAVVAHDLRNPVQAILLHIDALLADASGETVAVPVAQLLQLRRGGHRLAGMINDLLDASRIESSRLRLDPVSVSLRDALPALLARIRPTLGDHPIELSISDRPVSVRVDPARLDQIATNLLDNAAKYSPDGKPIRIGVCPEDDGVTLSVEDEGYGIAAEELPRLFDRFYQAGRARKAKSGLGLGLYIVKGLVESHGGRLRVESRVGQGSRFAVWLPAGHAESHALRDAAPRRSSCASPDR
jgi:signal transduction histidine kinase